MPEPDSGGVKVTVHVSLPSGELVGLAFTCPFDWMRSFRGEYLDGWPAGRPDLSRLCFE